jgi:hypothetical protein
MEVRFQMNNQMKMEVRFQMKNQMKMEVRFQANYKFKFITIMMMHKKYHGSRDSSIPSRKIGTYSPEKKT